MATQGGKPNLTDVDRSPELAVRRAIQPCPLFIVIAIRMVSASRKAKGKAT
jgi:hypothetical protein